MLIEIGSFTHYTPDTGNPGRFTLYTLRPCAGCGESVTDKRQDDVGLSGYAGAMARGRWTRASALPACTCCAP